MTSINSLNFTPYLAYLEVTGSLPLAEGMADTRVIFGHQKPCAKIPNTSDAGSFQFALIKRVTIIN